MESNVMNDLFLNNQRKLQVSSESPLILQGVAATPTCYLLLQHVSASLTCWRLSIFLIGAHLKQNKNELLMT